MRITHIRVDQRGLDEIAQSSGMQDAIREAGEAVADNARAEAIYVEGIPGDVALPVEVNVDVDDVATAFVTIAHPSGLAVQAKHGTLTKAAAQAGLSVQGGSF